MVRSVAVSSYGLTGLSLGNGSPALVSAYCFAFSFFMAHEQGGRPLSVYGVRVHALARRAESAELVGVAQRRASADGGHDNDQRAESHPS
jgi:hypothetical protein